MCLGSLKKSISQGIKKVITCCLLVLALGSMEPSGIGAILFTVLLVGPPPMREDSLGMVESKGPEKTLQLFPETELLAKI